MSENLDILKRINKLLEEGSNLSNKQREAFKNTLQDIQNGNNSLAQYNQLLGDIKNATDSISDDLDYINKSYADSLNELGKQNVALGTQKKALNAIRGIADDLQDIRRGDVTYTEKELKSLEEKSRKQYKNLQIARDIMKANGENTDAIDDQINKEELLIKAFEKVNEVNKKVNKELGFAPKILEGMDKTLQKMGFGSLGISDAVAETKRLAQQADFAGKKFSSAGTFVKLMGKNLAGAFTKANLLQAAFGALSKAVIESDKASGEFAKNNGISYQNALAIRGEMNEIARSSNDVVVSTKALMETQGTLNKFFGQSTKFTGKLAEDMASIAKRTGMSEEAQGTFALEAMKTGKGVKDILKTQTLTVMEMNKEKGLQMSVKQVQEAISKTSNAVFMTFKGNTKELTKQVMSVKALGANMAQVEGIASSLLEFESSIQAELEAELLLGKEINLEKAREAALRGDMGKVAEEVMKNDAIMNAFATDNVIQQEAAAKALGMNRDQLAGMIKEQEKLEAVRAAGFDNMNDAQKAYNDMRAKGLSKEEAAAKMKDKDLAAQLESVSAAEKFEATMARVQELFIALAEPILAIIQPIADILVPALNFVSDILTGIKDIISSIFDPTKSLSETFQEMGPVVSFIAAGLTAAGLAITAQMVPGLIRAAAAALTALPAMISTAIAAVTSASAATLGIGAIAIAAGIAAVIASMSSATSKAESSMKDGMIGPDGGMIVSGPKGSIQLDKEDSIIAGTNLIGDKNKPGKGGGAGGGSAALIAKVEQLITVNRQILAKSSVIEMNGNKVGEEINQSERKVQ